MADYHNSSFSISPREPRIYVRNHRLGVRSVNTPLFNGNIIITCPKYKMVRQFYYSALIVISVVTS